MANATDILFEPIQRSPLWRQLAQDVTEYIRTTAPVHKPMAQIYPIDRPRPNGSVTLEQLMEHFHLGGQNRFFVVVAGRHTKMLESFPFNGSIEFLRYEDGQAPRLGSYFQHSIRDMNLVPNTYTRHYVFTNEQDARTYMDSL